MDKQCQHEWITWEEDGWPKCKCQLCEMEYEDYKKESNGKCPFLKIIIEIPHITDSIDSGKDIIENFAECLGEKCMAYYHIFYAGFEEKGCRRLIETMPQK